MLGGGKRLAGQGDREACKRTGGVEAEENQRERAESAEVDGRSENGTGPPVLVCVWMGLRWNMETHGAAAVLRQGR